MEINAQTNTFGSGMNLDIDVNYIDSKQYKYAQNVRIVTDANGTTAVLQNIEKNKQYNFSFKNSQNIIGTATTKWYNEAMGIVEDCAVIITDNGDGTNSIYIVTGFDNKEVTSYLDQEENSFSIALEDGGLLVLDNTAELTSRLIVTAAFNLSGKLSIVTNYESQYVSNVYITDGNGLIKVINLQKTYENKTYNESAFDIVPDAILNPFTFDSFCTGALPAGQVQYAYKLFNKHSGETSLSPLSKKIPLAETMVKNESMQVKGQREGENTGLGCVIKTTFDTQQTFEYIRIYRLFYTKNNQVPEVTIVEELAISDNELTWQDTGNAGLSILSSDEINALIPYTFKAQTLETMDNRLFAANIQEDTWDVEYDARAYRCDKYGNIVLNSNDTSKTISGILKTDGTISGRTPSEDHDCINPSNLDLFSSAGQTYTYGYSNGTLVPGGSGPNISYRFTYTQLTQSSTIVGAREGNIARDIYLNSQKASGYIRSYYSDGTIAKSAYYNNIFPNYSSAHICADYTGYRRDEIYRFGIVLYNKKMIPSPVHWIGDIRMPASEYSKLDSIQSPFINKAKSTFYGDNTELISYALGVEFTVNNLPDEVVAYEIVRCDRTENDSTVLTQCVINKLIQFDEWGDRKYHVGDDIDIRPQMWISVQGDKLISRYRDDRYDDDSTQQYEKDYVELISPEIAFSKESFLPYIENSSIKPLYWADSKYGSIDGHGTDDLWNTHGNFWNIQKKMYVLWEEEKDSPWDETIGGTIEWVYGRENDISALHIGDVSRDSDPRIFLGEGSGWKHQGYCAVFKYYHITPQSNPSTDLSKATSAIIGQILPPGPPMGLSEVKQHIQLIGNKKYINSSVGGAGQWLNHGYGCVVELDSNHLYDSITNTPSTLKNDKWTRYTTGAICNVKRQVIGYGGNSHAVRTNSIYISCGAYNNKNVVKTICYGGDTYLNVFDHLTSSSIQFSNDVAVNRELRTTIISYIPLESSINLALRRDDCYHRTVESELLAQNLIQNEPTVFSNTYVQSEPLYQYNSAYSAQVNISNFISKSLYSEDDLLTQNRITCSEAKTNNEIIDSWTKFKFANYLDVDTQYGQITNLKVFKNKLYYFQDSAVGIASVNERSLITDNNPGALTLGTGGILVRYDYLVEHNGDSIINDKSIIDSNQALYWYDFDKNVLCQLNNGFVELSKAKNVQSYLHGIKDEDRTNPLSIYDFKYNEIQFKVCDSNLVYNENLGVFTSFYTYSPKFALQFSDKLVTILGDRFYLHNQGYTNLGYSQELLAKVQFVVNDNVLYTKVYDNQWFSADFIEDIKVIKEINSSTKHQKSETIRSNNIDYREDTYRFAIPREQQTDNYVANNKSYAGRMRGKYLICDYTFDCSGDKKFRLPYVKTTYRYSML